MQCSSVGSVFMYVDGLMLDQLGQNKKCEVLKNSDINNRDILLLLLESKIYLHLMVDANRKANN